MRVFPFLLLTLLLTVPSWAASPDSLWCKAYDDGGFAAASSSNLTAAT